MKGIRRLDPEWSLRWVQSRIVPYSRQNISEILRANGMDSYEEQKLLLKNEGRNCQDEFYLAPLPPKFFVHYGSEHFDRNRFAPVRNEKDRDKPTGGLWGYPTGSEEGRNKRRREEPHFIFRLNWCLSPSLRCFPPRRPRGSFWISTNNTVPIPSLETPLPL